MKQKIIIFKKKMHLIYLLSIFTLQVSIIQANDPDACVKEGILSKEKLTSLSKRIIPPLFKKRKGDAGKICVLGGSIEYTGAPYFSALTSLKVGADLVYVITTEDVAPIIKTYSPDLIVYPYLNKKYASKISHLIQKMDVIVIGPGFGREEEDVQLTLNTIETCKNLQKPLVIDADGLYSLSKNVSVLNNYPKPGVILTPNHREAEKLIEATKSYDSPQWYNYWGENVSILAKGYEDTCYSSDPKFNWSLLGGGSVRRSPGQGDILAGALGTFYNWALKANLCENGQSNQLAQSVAMYAAAKFTRTCNALAFEENGRNMVASDMLSKIHVAFEEIFSGY